MGPPQSVPSDAILVPTLTNDRGLNPRLENPRRRRPEILDRGVPAHSRRRTLPAEPDAEPPQVAELHVEPPATAVTAPQPAESDTGGPNKVRGGAVGKVLAKKRGPLSAAVSKKEKKRQRLEAAFKDYFAFQESISRIPPHRILAINRGERARISCA